MGCQGCHLLRHLSDIGLTEGPHSASSKMRATGSTGPPSSLASARMATATFCLPPVNSCHLPCTTSTPPSPETQIGPLCDEPFSRRALRTSEPVASDPARRDRNGRPKTPFHAPCPRPAICPKSRAAGRSAPIAASMPCAAFWKAAISAASGPAKATVAVRAAAETMPAVRRVRMVRFMSSVSVVTGGNRAADEKEIGGQVDGKLASALFRRNVRPCTDTRLGLAPPPDRASSIPGQVVVRGWAIHDSSPVGAANPDENAETHEPTEGRVVGSCGETLPNTGPEPCA